MFKKLCLTLALAIATFGSLFAQGSKVTITGTVVDEASVPVIGAVVTVKGNTALGGAVTGNDGEFTFSVPKGVTLEVSCIGYQTESKVIDGPGTWFVTLKDDSIKLDEVVVVGYGVQNKESIVGAISQINAATLEKSTTTSINNALAGKVSGLLSYSSSASGAPGENVESLMIRGLSSWNGNAPLVMVDGIEREMKELSPSEIASISVLKDASATAVYGAKGANGVILVTTKTGQKGAPKFHINAEYSMSNPVMLPEHVDALTTATMTNYAYKNQGSFGSQYSPEALQAFVDGSNPLRYPDTDFYALMLKKFAPGVNADMSLSGGTDRVKYYMGASYVHEGSIMKDLHELGETNYSSDRITYRLNLDINLTKSTKLSIKAGGNMTDTQGPITSSDNSSPTSSSVIFGYMYRASTIAYPAYYPEWALLAYPDPDYPLEHGIRLGNRQGNAVANPYSLMVDAAYIVNEVNRLNTDVILNQKLDFITKGLSASVKTGLSSKYGVTKEKVFVDNPLWDINWTSVDMGLENPWIRSTTSDYVWNLKPYEVTSSNSASGVNVIFYLEGALNYKRKFGKDHNVTALALYNQRQYNSAAAFPKRNQSFVARATYDYKGKYLFEANAGITGSEQFAPANRYGFFPSVAIGYYISKENWWKNAMPWWSTMKIRFSDGIVGSDNTTANWLYYTYWSKISAGGTYITEGAAANENARWETATKRDLGIEMGWLKNSLTLNVDFYNEDRNDILIQPVVTMFVATSYKDINAGSMKKHGVEIELGYRKSYANGFAFETGAMFGISENRILNYEDLPYAPQYQKYAGTQYGAMRTGETTVDDRFFNSVDEIHGYPTYSTTWDGNVVPGSFKYLDYDRNGAITSNDLHCVKGSVYAPGVYSLNFSCGYKGLSFNILGTGTIGKWLPINGEATVPFGRSELVTHVYTTDYWTPYHKDATAPAPMFSELMYSWGGGSVVGSTSNGYDIGLIDYTWRRSDYFMIKEARVSYTFDFQKLRNTAVKGLTVNLSGNNLLLLSNIKDMNPTATKATNAAYPQMRTLKLGVSFDF